MAPVLSAEFKKAEAASYRFGEKPDTDDSLELYGLYKVAKGEVPEKKPGWGIDWTFSSRQKAYDKVKHMDPAKAQQEYVKLVEKLKPKYKYDPNNKPAK